MPRTDLRPQLRHQVELRTRTETVNGLGEYIGSYSSTATVWADVSPLSQGELYRAQRLGQTTSHRVIIRWRASAPATGDRIKWGTRWLRVETVTDPDTLREWLEIMATDEGEVAPV